MALAIVSPGNHVAPDPSHSNSTLVSPKDDRISSVSDQDVLCGRGKGMRKHPGNDLYNKLLREHYEEYKSAPKGSKLSIVKKIVDFVREGQASGRGRFLERKLAPKSMDISKNASSKWFYVDIGNERAMNKTVRDDCADDNDEDEHCNEWPYLTVYKLSFHPWFLRFAS